MALIDYADDGVRVTSDSDDERDLLAQTPWVHFVFAQRPCHWHASADRLLAMRNLLPYAQLTEAAQLEIHRRETEAARIVANARGLGRKAEHEADARFEQLVAKGFHRYEHQIEGYQRMSQWPRTVNADGPGLGKTLQGALAAYGWHKAVGLHTHILSPKPVIGNWQSELESIAPDMPYSISTWASMPEPFEVPYALIADEAHLGKAGYGTKRGAAFLKLALHPNCVACWPMSGSPEPNGRAMEFWPLLRAVNAWHSLNVDFYRENAARPGWLHTTNLPFVIRRGRAECPGMPPLPIRTLHQTPRTDKAEAHFFEDYNKLRDNYFDRINACIISDEAYALAQLTHLTHASAHVMADYACELAETILESGRPVVIFCEFVDVVERIGRWLAKWGVEVLTGSSSKKAHELTERFQNGQSQVFVMNHTGGLGITLTRAHDLIMVGRRWTPTENEQIECRVDRTSQVTQCHIYWIEYDKVTRAKDEVCFWKLEAINADVEGERKTLRRRERLDLPALLEEVMLHGPI